MAIEQNRYRKHLSYAFAVLSSQFLGYFYADYPDIEDAFMAELDKSLDPRSAADLRYEIVAGLGLEPGAKVLDVGCGEGRYAFQLAEQFGFEVRGVDPVEAHIDISNEALSRLRSAEPSVADRIRFELGSITEFPEDIRDFDLVWAYDMFEHIEELDAAFGECFRALRDGGYMLIYSQFATDKLETDEAEFLSKAMGLTTTSANPKNLEAACMATGFEIVDQIEFHGEYQERNEEDKGSVGRHLLHASRLLRAPERYIEQFGQAAYDIKLGDCLWHIYPMIGKLSPRIYVLRRPAG